MLYYPIICFSFFLFWRCLKKKNNWKRRRNQRRHPNCYVLIEKKKGKQKNKADKEPKVAKTPIGQVCLLVLYLPNITKKKKRDEKEESTAMKTRETPSFPSSKKKKRQYPYFPFTFYFCENDFWPVKWTFFLIILLSHDLTTSLSTRHAHTKEKTGFFFLCCCVSVLARHTILNEKKKKRTVYQQIK